MQIYDVIRVDIPLFFRCDNVGILSSLIWGRSCDIDQGSRHNLGDEREHILLTVSTVSMENRPFRIANKSSASQEILRILWKPKVHDDIHKHPLSLSILSHINPGHSPSQQPSTWVFILVLSSNDS
jgi:hypothetical protein